MDKKKILVVEDSESWQYWLGQLIEEAGHEVVGPAVNMRTALALLNSRAPDLVTMDGTLFHGEKGLTVAEAIRKENRVVPILMITLEGEEKFEGRGLGKIGFDDDHFKALVAELLS